MSLPQRLAVLEQRVGRKPACRACGDRQHPRLVWYRQDGVDGTPVVDEGQTLPEPCPACGGTPPTRAITIVVISTREEVEELERREKVTRAGRQ
jgi:hypothetical protein